MILLEQYIELRIYHFNKFRKYDVLEVANDDDGVCFIVLHRGYYVFTLIPKREYTIKFELSEFDKDQHISIDMDLYSKVQTSLYSVFLEEMPS